MGDTFIGFYYVYAIMDQYSSEYIFYMSNYSKQNADILLTNKSLLFNTLSIFSNSSGPPS